MQTLFCVVLWRHSRRQRMLCRIDWWYCKSWFNRAGIVNLCGHLLSCSYHCHRNSFGKLWCWFDTLNSGDVAGVYLYFWSSFVPVIRSRRCSIYTSFESSSELYGLGLQLYRMWNELDIWDGLHYLLMLKWYQVCTKIFNCLCTAWDWMGRYTRGYSRECARITVIHFTFQGREVLDLYLDIWRINIELQRELDSRGMDLASVHCGCASREAD